MNKVLLLILSLGISSVFAQENPEEIYLQVHFLYGSKPAKKFKKTEKRWFGGILGGHVGLGLDSNQILNFTRKGKFHIFPSKKRKHSTFLLSNAKEFYSILGSNSDQMKKAIIFIPITAEQKAIFEQVAQKYLQETPYDYAFFGMRCAAATYDVLAQMGIMKSYKRSKISRKIFYPRKLRKRLLAMALQNNWTIIRCEGTTCRKWERDIPKKLLTQAK
ncbi:MAG: hypothetical protein RMJ97_00010 [Raineya sp.]|nr:hypothetical protein [Raineya sp.]